MNLQDNQADHWGFFLFDFFITILFLKGVGDIAIAFVCISGFCLLCYLLNNWTDYPAKFVEQLVYSTVKFQYPNDLGCRSKVSFGLPICLQYYHLANGLFVCFVALRPKSTAMVMAGRSVHLTTLFPGQALTSS